MTKTKPQSLPPVPAFTNEQLERGDARFNEIDKIVRQMTAKRGLNLAKSLDGDVIPSFVRRQVFFAGLTAHRDAKHWYTHRDEIGRNGKGFIEKIKTFQSLASDIRKDAREIRDDAYRVPSRVEEILHATETVEMAQLAFDEMIAWLEEEDPGREDPLTKLFILNLADVWRTLTGAYAPTSSEGPFVDFADAAWSALGWNKYRAQGAASKRDSLGKRIKQIAASQHWALFRRLDRQPSNGATADDVIAQVVEETLGPVGRQK